MSKLDAQLRAQIISDLLEDIQRGIAAKTGIDIPDDQTITLAEVHYEFLVDMLINARNISRVENNPKYEDLLKKGLVQPLIKQGLGETNATQLIDGIFSQP